MERGARVVSEAAAAPGKPADLVEALEQRSGGTGFIRATLRYVFPDHWSFLLGEIALYSFMVLVGTGVFLALFFEPSLAETTYDGSYAPLRRPGDEPRLRVVAESLLRR